MMKKLLALILAILIVCLAACTADPDASEEEITESATAETTTEEAPSNDLGGMYIFTADEATAESLGKYSWFPEYGVKFGLVLTLGEGEKAELALHISSIEEIEEALFEKANHESAEANGMSYEDFYTMILEQTGSEEAMRENFRQAHTSELPDIQSNLIDTYPQSGTYRTDGENVVVTFEDSEMTFVLDGGDLVTEQNGCPMNFRCEP